MLHDSMKLRPGERVTFIAPPAGLPPSEADRQLVKQALAHAAALGRLPWGMTAEATAQADADFVRRLLAAFSVVDRLTDPLSGA